jgi:hypothetical protein
LARRIPALILSTMSDRSSSAILPTMVKNMRLIGPLVSIASLAETNSMLTLPSSSTISKKFFVERAIRSKAATNTTENSPRRASAIMVSRPGRLVLEPEIPRSQYSRVISKPRWAASFRKSYNCVSTC